MNHFGQNLKTLRIEKKLSQTELGQQLHKGQKTIGNWETGYSEPCMDDLLRLGEFFDIGIDALLKNELKENNPAAKARRNRHKHDEEQTQQSPDIIDVKRVLQEAAKKSGVTDYAEMVWRDKYIAVLENHLFESNSGHISKETVQDLMTQMLTIQKMVAELIVSSSDEAHRSVVS